MEVNIEIQTDVSKYSEERCLQHWSKIYSNNLKKGGEYKDLGKVICIWILDGSVYNEFDDFHSKWRIMNENHWCLNCFQQLEFHIIELNKFRNLDIIKPSKKEFWLWFIDHTSEDMVKMSCVNNDKIKEAREQLEKIKADKELMEKIRLQESAEWDYNSKIIKLYENSQVKLSKFV